MYNGRKKTEGVQGSKCKMESLSERNENQRYENAKKWKKRRKRIIILLVTVVVVIGALISIWNYYTKCYKGYRVIDSIERIDASISEYTVYDDSLMKYSRDGAVGFNAKLDMIWSGSYDFASPIIDVSGKYAAVADLDGKEIYVFNGSDSPKEIKVLYPINLVRVASQGVVVVAMSREKSDLVQIYDSNNKELLVEFTTNVSDDGYPVDMAFSSDGRKLVTTYLNVTNGKITSKVTFYNLGEVGKNYSNNIVAAKTYDKEIISRVEFIGKNNICAFGEKGYYLYSMRQLVSDINDATFKRTIKSIFFTDEYYGFVLESGTGKTSYALELYDSNGKIKFEKTFNYPYKKVYMVEDEIIFLADQECHILRTNGTEKFDCQFKSPVSYIMPAEGYNHYMLVDDNSISTIKIVGD